MKPIDAKPSPSPLSFAPISSLIAWTPPFLSTLRPSSTSARSSVVAPQTVDNGAERPSSKRSPSCSKRRATPASPSRRSSTRLMLAGPHSMPTSRPRSSCWMPCAMSFSPTSSRTQGKEKPAGDYITMHRHRGLRSATFCTTSRRTGQSSHCSGMTAVESSSSISGRL